MTASPHRPGDDRFSVGVLVGMMPPTPPPPVSPPPPPPHPPTLTLLTPLPKVGTAGELSLAWRGAVQQVDAVRLACGDSLTLALDADNGLLLLARRLTNPKARA
jgi:hypothetical protein